MSNRNLVRKRVMCPFNMVMNNAMCQIHITMEVVVNWNERGHKNRIENKILHDNLSLFKFTTDYNRKYSYNVYICVCVRRGKLEVFDGANRGL